METAPITISTKLNFRNYFRGSLMVTYQRPVIILCTVIGFASLILGAVENLTTYYLIPPLTCGVLGVYLLLVFPLILYFKVRREFRSKSRMTEAIDYTISTENLRMKGETFDVTFTWEKIQKVTERKEFFFIFQSPAVAFMIPKEKMSADEISRLRQLIPSISGLKYSLRND